MAQKRKTPKRKTHLDNNHQTTNQSLNPTSPSHLSPFYKKLGVIFFALVIIALLLYFLYTNFFLYFKPLATLEYNTNEAVRILQDENALAFSRGDAIFISNLKDTPLEIIPSNEKFGQNVGHISISNSKSYLMFTTDKGILGLSVKDKKLFLIYNERQAYDLSLNFDKIALAQKNKAVEVDLKTGRKNKIGISLPNLKPELKYNFLQYSPNREYILAGGINNSDLGKVVPIVYNINTKQQFNLPEEFINPNTILVWSFDSNFLIAKNSAGISAFNISTQQVEKLIDSSPSVMDTRAFGVLDNNQIAYIVSKTKLHPTSYGYTGADRFINPEISIFSKETALSSAVIDSNNPVFGQSYPYFADVGYLDENNIWFTTIEKNYLIKLWKTNIATSQTEVLIQSINRISKKSPNWISYDLY